MTLKFKNCVLKTLEKAEKHFTLSLYEVNSFLPVELWEVCEREDDQEEPGEEGEGHHPHPHHPPPHHSHTTEVGFLKLKKN